MQKGLSHVIRSMLRDEATCFIAATFSTYRCIARPPQMMIWRVNLAQLSMSVFCYPMGATIGCGLQNADAFPLKKHILLSKNTPRRSVTCHAKLIPLHRHASWCKSWLLTGWKLKKMMENTGRKAQPISNRLSPMQKFTLLIKSRSKTERKDAQIRLHPNKDVWHRKFVVKFMWINK